MYLRKFNVLLFILSIVGAVIGCIGGELLLMWGEYKLPAIVLIGLYIGQLAMWICVCCLVAEIINPQINGNYWKMNNVKSGIKLVVPVSLVILILGGIVFQFLYGITFNKAKTPNQYVILLDISESMLETDPNYESLSAVERFINQLDTNMKVAVVLFNHSAYVVQPITDVTNSQTKQDIVNRLQEFVVPNGGTNFSVALKVALEEVQRSSQSTDATHFILLSDGYSEVDLATALQPIKDNKISVSTIGMNAFQFEGNNVLKSIAYETKGSFYLVDEISQVSNAINTIYEGSQNWHLVNERNIVYAEGLYYKMMRVLAFIAFGLLIGLSLGMIFDNRYIAKSFMIGGAISGLIAGVWIESLFAIIQFGDSFIRLITAVILAIVLSLSTVIVPFKRVNDISLTNGSFSSRQKFNSKRTYTNNQHRF